MKTSINNFVTVFFVSFLFFFGSVSASASASASSSSSENTCANNMASDGSSTCLPTVAELLSKSKDDIMEALGGLYEHSSWAAEGFIKSTSAEERAKLSTVTDLAAALKVVVDNAPRAKQLELLRAHPDLAAKVETLKTLTADSQTEQNSAGLQSLAGDELDAFTAMNKAYKDKFSFPFILAVRNASKDTVLSALRGRLNNPLQQEFATAIQQVHKIAWMRLLSKINTDDANGFLTCHVLDTASGIPAAGMKITLNRLTPEDKAGVVGTFVTNSDGRLEGGPALKGGKEFLVGTYEWTFYAGDYFASQGTFTSGTPFLDVIPLRFGIDNPDDHYHVPLLVSPWSFSTYRGS